MADIVLDDLITKDKEKLKQARKVKPGLNKNSNKGPRGRKNSPPNKSNTHNTHKQNKPSRDNRNVRQRDDSPPTQREERPRDEGRRLRVMGLHPDVNSDELLKLFTQQGALEVCKVDQDNFGRSLTTATVVYHSAQNAQTAISELNGRKIMNSVITVELARAKSNVPHHKKIFKRPPEVQHNRQQGNKPFRGRGKKFSR